jgi:NAD-dependent SIR2 family protein deacetylase
VSAEAEQLRAWLEGRRVFVLTGAGVSTESGIPDYRGPETRHRVRRPVQHRDFVSDAKARARYWARSVLGWPRFRAFEPNGAHRALAALQARGVVRGLLTQNVDRLHTKAGSPEVLELHGSLYWVRCLACGAREHRDAFQERLAALNPGASQWAYALAPDGDADIPAEALDGFRVAPCARCGGVLKPDVVFFGDNVPPPRVAEAFALLEGCDALWVIGSSLHVYSGYRFVLAAQARALPIAILNLGSTRGDEHAQLRIDARAGEVLPQVAQLTESPAATPQP